MLAVMTNKTHDDEPPMSYADFVASTGNSPVTGWRWEKNGLVRTINILGRKYIAREEVRRFNGRAAAGEFARKVTIGRSSSSISSPRRS